MENEKPDVNTLIHEYMEQYRRVHGVDYHSMIEFESGRIKWGSRKHRITLHEFVERIEELKKQSSI